MDDQFPMSQTLFDELLWRKRPNHDVYAENGNMLMSKLGALDAPNNARGLVSGFVTPRMDYLLKKEVLQFSSSRGWTTTIKGGICKPAGGGPPFARYTLVIIRG